MAKTDSPKGSSKKLPKSGAGGSAAAGKAAHPPHTGDEEIRAATQHEGGVGGRSGTGQMQPHHRFDDPSGKQATQRPVTREAELPEPSTGMDYQSGGSGMDREQRLQERRQRESGVGDTMKQGPGLDSPPGAPLRRRS